MAPLFDELPFLKYQNADKRVYLHKYILTFLPLGDIFEDVSSETHRVPQTRVDV